MGKSLEWTFLQRKCTNGQYAHEKMLRLISPQGNANQDTMRYHLTPTRMARLKKWEITGVDENVGKLEPSHTADGNGKCAGTLENNLAVHQSFKPRITM